MSLSSHPLTHRLALSISGGVALGTYMAGALCQLYRDLYHFNRAMEGRAKVHIDAIAGASAGSLTGLILAYSLAMQETPDAFEARMRGCWVAETGLDVRNLLSPDDDPANALFTESCIQRIAHATLQEPSETVVGDEDIALWITMTNLDGVPYQVDFNRSGVDQTHTTFYALDYKDYVPLFINGSSIYRVDMPIEELGDEAFAARRSDADYFRLTPSDWATAREAAITSAAFPIAFHSRLEKRDLNLYQGFREFSKDTCFLKKPLPTQAVFECVDGGLLNNQPIGRAIDAVSYLERRHPERKPAVVAGTPNCRQVSRTFLVVEPDPNLPEKVAATLQANPLDAYAAYVGGFPPVVFGKIINAYFNHALYEDFDQAAKINRQLEALQEAFDTHLGGLGAEQRVAIETAVRKAVGLDYKSEITLERIPHISEDTDPRTYPLACAFLGHFGGFLDQEYREADFLTGQWEARRWLEAWLLLWLRQNAPLLDIAENEITPEWVAERMDRLPPDPSAYVLPGCGLTPAELGRRAGWGNDGTQEPPALTMARRIEIFGRAEERLQSLIGRWLPPAIPYLPTVQALFENKISNMYIDREGPNNMRWKEALIAFGSSTLPADLRRRLWRWLVLGGVALPFAAMLPCAGIAALCRLAFPAWPESAVTWGAGIGFLLGCGLLAYGYDLIKTYLPPE